MGIIEVYNMINYIHKYISNKDDINNYAYFPYFDYDNLLYVYYDTFFCNFTIIILY